MCKKAKGKGVKCPTSTTTPPESTTGQKGKIRQAGRQCVSVRIPLLESWNPGGGRRGKRKRQGEVKRKACSVYVYVCVCGVMREEEEGGSAMRW